MTHINEVSLDISSLKELVHPKMEMLLKTKAFIETKIPKLLVFQILSY